jgi:hypothetical protein
MIIVALPVANVVFFLEAPLLLPQICYAFLEDVSAKEPQRSYIDHGGYDDAGSKQQIGIADAEGGKIGGEHGCHRHKQERSDVLQGMERRELYLAPKKVVPYGSPDYERKGIERNHQRNAADAQYVEIEQMHEAGCGCEGASLGYDVPHIDVGLATANDKVIVERGDGEKGTAYAEYAHKNGTGKPLVGDEDSDKLRSDESEP